MKRLILTALALAIVVSTTVFLTRVVSTAKSDVASKVQQHETSDPANGPIPPSLPSLEELNPEQLFARCSPAVVKISTADKDGKSIATGTGFIISPDGLLVTNYHVLQNAEVVTATLTNGSEQRVTRFQFARPLRDLIVLKLNEGKYPHLDLADKTPAVGSKVYTIGNPEGLHNTLSDGLVSSIRNDGTPYEQVQISAPISPGSSGGPALDKSGKVIGVTTSFVREAQNLNFAISSRTIKDLLRGQLGQPEPLEHAPFWWIAKANARLNRIGNNKDVIEIQAKLGIAYARTGDITSAMALLDKLSRDKNSDFLAKALRDEIVLSLAECSDIEQALKLLQLPLPRHVIPAGPYLPPDWQEMQQRDTATLSRVSLEVYLRLVGLALARGQPPLAQRICSMIEPGQRSGADEAVLASRILNEGYEALDGEINRLSTPNQIRVWYQVASLAIRDHKDKDVDAVVKRLEAIAADSPKDDHVVTLCHYALLLIYHDAHRKLQLPEPCSQLFAAASVELAKTGNTEFQANYALQIFLCGNEEMALRLVKELLKAEPLEKYDDWDLVNIAIIQAKAGDSQGFDRTMSLMESRVKRDDINSPPEIGHVIEVAGAIGDLPRINSAFAVSNRYYKAQNKMFANSLTMDTFAVATATDALLEYGNWNALTEWVSDLDTPAKQALAQANIAAKLAEQLNKE